MGPWIANLLGAPSFPFAMGFPDLVVIAALAAVLFGGKKLGDLGKGLGEGIRSFKEALKDEEEKKDEKSGDVSAKPIEPK